MKKILLAISLILLVNLPCLAVITPEDAMSQDYFENHSYSSEMSRLIDLQRSQINGTKPLYIEKNDKWNNNHKTVNFVRKVFIYFDPGLDDGKYGKGHDIKFSTGVNDL